MTGAWLRPGFASGGIVAATLPPALLDAAATPGPPADDDERWMIRALRLAMANNGLASPNPVVGCVLVRDGREIAGGATERWGERHAERVAVDAARGDLAGATLHVTLEPCTMCAAAISFARLRRLYFGAADPKGGAVEHGVKFFTAATCHHRPEVYGGLGEREAADLLRAFFAARR